MDLVYALVRRLQLPSRLGVQEALARRGPEQRALSGLMTSTVGRSAGAVIRRRSLSCPLPCSTRPMAWSTSTLEVSIGTARPCYFEAQQDNLTTSIGTRKLHCTWKIVCC